MVIKPILPNDHIIYELYLKKKKAIISLLLIHLKKQKFY